MEAKKYMIIGTGRSGSSVLSAIMHSAGADFAMRGTQEWNRKSGSFEHKDLHRAYMWELRMEKLKKTLLPKQFAIRLCKRKIDSHLQSLCSQAEYCKSATALWLTHRIVKLGYTPIIIVSYRPFMDYFRSRHLRFGWSYEKCRQEFVDVYSTALMQLEIFGGCAVNYDDICKGNRKWAKALSKISQLQESALLENAEKILSDKRSSTSNHILEDPEDVQRVYTALERYSGSPE